jgi:2,3,4,5-tetrahydropyridine-2-carboxylate N-succinyltransferase
MQELRATIENAWENRELLQNADTQEAIRAVVSALDSGELRVAEPTADGWQVNEWVKKAVVLYFPIQKMETIEVPPFEFHDKIPLKTGYAEKGVRVVPHAIARHGSFLASGVIMMPSLREYWEHMWIAEPWWILGLLLVHVHRLVKTFTSAAELVSAVY